MALTFNYGVVEYPGLGWNDGAVLTGQTINASVVAGNLLTFNKETGQWDYAFSSAATKRNYQGYCTGNAGEVKVLPCALVYTGHLADAGGPLNIFGTGGRHTPYSSENLTAMEDTYFNQYGTYPTTYQKIASEEWDQGDTIYLVIDAEEAEFGKLTNDITTYNSSKRALVGYSGIDYAEDETSVTLRGSVDFVTNSDMNVDFPTRQLITITKPADETWGFGTKIYWNGTEYSNNVQKGWVEVAWCLKQATNDDENRAFIYKLNTFLDKDEIDDTYSHNFKDYVWVMPSNILVSHNLDYIENLGAGWTDLDYEVDIALVRALRIAQSNSKFTDTEQTSNWQNKLSVMPIAKKFTTADYTDWSGSYDSNFWVCWKAVQNDSGSTSQALMVPSLVWEDAQSDFEITTTVNASGGFNYTLNDPFDNTLGNGSHLVGSALLTETPSTSGSQPNKLTHYEPWVGQQGLTGTTDSEGKNIKFSIRGDIETAAGVTAGYYRNNLLFNTPGLQSSFVFTTTDLNGWCRQRIGNGPQSAVFRDFQDPSTHISYKVKLVKLDHSTKGLPNTYVDTGDTWHSLSPGVTNSGGTNALFKYDFTSIFKTESEPWEWIDQYWLEYERVYDVFGTPTTGSGYLAPTTLATIGSPKFSVMNDGHVPSPWTCVPQYLSSVTDGESTTIADSDWMPPAYMTIPDSTDVYEPTWSGTPALLTTRNDNIYEVEWDTSSSWKASLPVGDDIHDITFGDICAVSSFGNNGYESGNETGWSWEVTQSVPLSAFALTEVPSGGLTFAPEDATDYWFTSKPTSQDGAWSPRQHILQTYNNGLYGSDSTTSSHDVANYTGDWLLKVPMLYFEQDIDVKIRGYWTYPNTYRLYNWYTDKHKVDITIPPLEVITSESPEISGSFYSSGGDAGAGGGGDGGEDIIINTSQGLTGNPSLPPNATYNNSYTYTLFDNVGSTVASDSTTSTGLTGAGLISTTITDTVTLDGFRWFSDTSGTITVNPQLTSSNYPNTMNDSITGGSFTFTYNGITAPQLTLTGPSTTDSISGGGTFELEQFIQLNNTSEYDYDTDVTSKVLKVTRSDSISGSRTTMQTLSASTSGSDPLWKYYGNANANYDRRIANDTYVWAEYDDSPASSTYGLVANDRETLLGYFEEVPVPTASIGTVVTSAGNVTGDEMSFYFKSSAANTTSGYFEHPDDYSGTFYVTTTASSGGTPSFGSSYSASVVETSGTSATWADEIDISTQDGWLWIRGRLADTVGGGTSLYSDWRLLGYRESTGDGSSCEDAIQWTDTSSDISLGSTWYYDSDVGAYGIWVEFYLDSGETMLAYASGEDTYAYITMEDCSTEDLDPSKTDDECSLNASIYLSSYYSGRTVIAFVGDYDGSDGGYEITMKNITSSGCP